MNIRDIIASISGQLLMSNNDSILAMLFYQIYYVVFNTSVALILLFKTGWVAEKLQLVESEPLNIPADKTDWIELATDPKKDFLKGMLYAFIYYAAGLGLAALSYAIVGHPYIHAPGLHHWIIFLTFTGSFVWTLAAVVKYRSGTRTWKLKGIILTNAATVLSFIVVIYTILHVEREVITEAGNEISMLQQGDTTILYHNDNIIYMKVRDSVFLNFIDSARFQGVPLLRGSTRRKDHQQTSD